MILVPGFQQLPPISWTHLNRRRCNQHYPTSTRHIRRFVQRWASGNYIVCQRSLKGDGIRHHILASRKRILCNGQFWSSGWNDHVWSIGYWRAYHGFQLVHGFRPVWVSQYLVLLCATHSVIWRSLRDVGDKEWVSRNFLSLLSWYRLRILQFNDDAMCVPNPYQSTYHNTKNIKGGGQQPHIMPSEHTE